MKSTSALFSSGHCSLDAFQWNLFIRYLLRAAGGEGNVGAIKGYLLAQVNKMDAAAHDYAANAEAYQRIIDANGGDYNKAAINNGAQLLSLVARMQGDYKNLHMNGYETVEGIAAGVKELVQYDIYFDSGVPFRRSNDG